MAWQTLREIVEELDVSVCVDLYTETFPRFDEAWEGLKWILSRSPEPKGSAVKATPEGEKYRAYVLAGDLLAGTPDIWVVYRFTDAQVIILGVQASIPKEEDDDGVPEAVQ